MSEMIETITTDVEFIILSLLIAITWLKIYPFGEKK